MGKTELKLTHAPLAHRGPEHRMGRPHPAVQSLAQPLHVGATQTRELHFDASDISHLRALMGDADDATLLGALLSSHLMGCAVQMAHEAEPRGTTVTVNHRVHRKTSVAAGRNVKITVRLTALQWNENLDAWTLDLEGQAHDAVTQAGLMTSCTSLRVMPGETW